jgi:hypothetical protein
MPIPPDDLHLPLVKRIPPTSGASPSDLRPRDPQQVRWYLPGWGETARLFGWRWFSFTPAAALIALMIYLPWVVLLHAFVFWWKLVVIAVMVPMVAVVNAAKNIIRSRTDPFCIHCGYTLEGLPDNYVCPECGEPYSFHVIDEYRRDPHWFISRCKQRSGMPAADVPFEAGRVVGKRSRDGT